MRSTAIRRLIALGAAYAVALQVLLPSFVLVAGDGVGVQICSSVHRENPDRSLPPNSHCAACPTLCEGTGLVGAAPAAFEFLSLPANSGLTSFASSSSVTRPSSRVLPPSRAPPLAAPVLA